MSDEMPTTERKTRLLDAVIDELMSNGLSDMSLRDLAARLGTSHRILLYHFGSKESLVNLAVHEVRRRERESFDADRARSREHQATVSEMLHSFFNHNTSDGMRPYFLLLYEVWGRANVQPERWRVFLDGIVLVWVEVLTEMLVEAGLSPARAASRATLVLAALRGLQLDLFTTNDRERVQAAFDGLVDLILLENGGESHVARGRQPHPDQHDNHPRTIDPIEDNNDD